MIVLDFREFERAAARLNGAADQVSFAVSRSLNKAILTAEKRLASETWAQHTANRNKGFLRAALSPEFSDKRNLRAGLVDSLGRAKLYEHDHGGTVHAAKRFAIPTAAVQRTSKGVRQNQKPGNLNPKNKVVKGGLIFNATGRGKHRKLTLLYKLQPSVQIKADVPLTEDFRRYVQEEARREFPKAMMQAMRTRK